MIHLDWALSLAPEESSGTALVEDGQHARNAIVTAVVEHLSGITDEDERREVAADWVPRLGQWVSLSAKGKRRSTYTAPGISVHLNPRAEGAQEAR